jgi:hypothetical protein
MSKVRFRPGRAGSFTRLAALCALAVAAFVSTPAARAESVIAEGTVFGGKQTFSTELSVTTAGHLTLHVTDLGVPTSIIERLSSLSFGITDGKSVLGTWDKEGVAKIDLRTPGTYMMFLACVPGGERFGLGLVTWNVVFEALDAPVPLPATFWLLIGGLVWAIGLQRNRARLARMSLPEMAVAA